MFVVIALMLSFGMRALAETNLGLNVNTSVKAGNIGVRADMKAQLDALKAERESFVQSVQAQKADFQKNILAERTAFRGRVEEMMKNRFVEAVRNLENLEARIQARVDLEKAAGKDTASAEAFLATAKTKLAAVKVQLASLQTLIPTTDTKVTADVFANIKIGAHSAKEALKEVHGALVEAIKSLK